jgi:glycosyltransferase involved in cell wall biosynthesis
MGEKQGRPLFSVGVTTYDRNDLLVECLNSILQQDFHDVEVVVGNDYQGQVLTEDVLGIHDPRVRIINHPVNLGPIANANALIEMSSGRYFTLLADDDMHMRHFLHVMSNLLQKHDYPPCIFASFTSDPQIASDPDIPRKAVIDRSKAFTGRQFLNLYLSREVSTIGCYGVFEIEYLKRIGGMRQLGDGRSMYGEYPLAIASGLLERVIYVDYPLVFFRNHEGSLSNTSTDPAAYASSQKALLRECIGWLRAGNLRSDFEANMTLLLKWFAEDFVEVMHRSGSLQYKQAIGYTWFMARSIGYLKFGSPCFRKAVGACVRIPGRRVLSIGKARFAPRYAEFAAICSRLARCGWIRRAFLRR